MENFSRLTAEDRQLTGAAVLQDIARNHRERCDLDPLQAHARCPLMSQAFNTKWKVARNGLVTSVVDVSYVYRRMRCRLPVFRLPSATMTVMKKLVFLLMVLLPMSAGAQAPAVNSDDSYEFILAKLAAEDGRYDEALAKVDKLVNKSPDNVVLQYTEGIALTVEETPNSAEARPASAVEPKQSP